MLPPVPIPETAGTSFLRLPVPSRDNKHHHKFGYIEFNLPYWYSFSDFGLLGINAGFESLRIGAKHGGFTIDVLTFYSGLDPLHGGIGINLKLFSVSGHINIGDYSVEVSFGVGCSAMVDASLLKDILTGEVRKGKFEIDFGLGTIGGVTINKRR